MNLTINNYPVDFELEDEKNLPDIIEAIVKWSKERQLIFTEVQLDDAAYQVDEIPDVDIADIGHINCMVHSKADIIFSSIGEGNSYCDRAYCFIKESLEKNSSVTVREMEEFQTGLEWLLEVILKVVELIGIDINSVNYKDTSIADFLNRLQSVTDSLKSPGNDKEIARFLDTNKDILISIKNVFKILLSSDEMKKMVIHNIESPDVIIRALAEIKNELPDQLTNIEDIAVAYQSGKDGEGAEKLNIFIDFIYRYIKVCYQIIPLFNINLTEISINGTNLEEKNGSIQEMLAQATEIFENNDIVSLSDILEYEIRPELEDLPQYVDALLEQIDSNQPES